MALNSTFIYLSYPRNVPAIVNHAVVFNKSNCKILSHIYLTANDDGRILIAIGHLVPE